MPEPEAKGSSPKPTGEQNTELAASASNTSSDSQADDAVPTEVVEALKDLPPDQRKVVSSMLISMNRISSSGSSSLAKRLTSEHITQTLDNLEKENERDFKKSQSSEVTKRLSIGAILVLALMVFGYAGLTKDKELAEKVIIAGISGIGGYGAGVAARKRE
ncbi:hypothetical protein LEP3755_25610 [Leptolyngbya sp. NIES-3755]|nr:hypothetical protein LEP3755_25610 [Leptolyngbya sp. NIES-3755]